MDRKRFEGHVSEYLSNRMRVHPNTAKPVAVSCQRLFPPDPVVQAVDDHFLFNFLHKQLLRRVQHRNPVSV